MKRALVTGGAGFLGSHIADQLSARGFDVTVFDRNPSPWLRDGQRMVVGDITDGPVVAEAVRGQDAVFHLAALADLNAGKTRPTETVRINVLGTLNVLEGLRANPSCRLMFASTVYVYSREGGFYRCSKQACESYIEEYRRTFDIRYTVLRYGSLYGPRADASNGIYRLLRQAMLEGRVHYPGGPDDVREYVHVEDAAGLSVDALDPGFEDKHIVLTGASSMRAADIFTMFSEIIGREVAVTYGHQKHGHYAVTPYAYTPKPGRKLTSNNMVDMGQGLLQVIEQLHHEQDAP